MLRIIGLITTYTIMICCAFYTEAAMSISEETGTPYRAAVDLKKIQILDLKIAQKITMAGNPSLAAAEERILQAKQRIQQARSSYWPKLNITGSGTRIVLSDNDYQAALALGTMDNESDAYRLGLSASWTLFDGFAREFSNMNARYGEAQSIEARMDALRLLLLSVAAGYYSAQLARENIIIAEANEAFNRRQLEEANARYRVGTGALSDVLNFQVRINSAKAELIAAKSTYEVALYSLAALMGIPDAKLPSHIELDRLEDETPDELISPDPGHLSQYALEHRPDVRQMDYLVKQSEANVGSARAAFYPTISLMAYIDGDRADNTSFERNDFGDSISLNLSYPLFAGGYNRARLSETKSMLKEAERNLEGVKIKVISEVESAIAQLKSAQDQLSLQRSNTKLVQETRELVEKEYAAGQGSLVRLNEAQRDLVTAQSLLALSLVSMRLAWENLKSSTAQILVTATE